ncbi:molybdate ABC transporter substrate-binding protein [Mesorhizobium sp. WSM2239]|uniref:Molybdate ABC transporter substrate-binding protein n=2 Tax=unclassified Mesorhizobium TaxID=325217 RepID=A0AAU8D7E9_9HYPH
MGRNGWRFAALIGAMVMALSSAPSVHSAEKVVVFAAASLKNALDAVNETWQTKTGQTATISYAASSALARQIEQGAPADIFISADLDWMEYLSEKQLIAPGSRTNLLGNRIVLIAATGSTIETSIAPDFPLAELLGNGRLAMGDVKAVPAGKYGKAALERLGVWAEVEDKVAQAENVRAALKLVAIGEAPLGIVYQSDAVAEPAVKVIGIFPEETHPPIVYPAAVIADSKNPDAVKFVKHLQSAKARRQFEAQGFTVLAPVASN